MERATINFPERDLQEAFPTEALAEEVSSQSLMQEIMQDPISFIQQEGLTLFEFIEVFWAEVSKDEFKPNWHIPYLCEELEALARRVGHNLPKTHDLIINIPPGTTKTLTCSVMFPVWCWTRWPWMKFICCSYSGLLALESAEKSRDIIRSDKFKMLFPHIGIKEDKNTKSNYQIYTKEFVKRRTMPRQMLAGTRYSTSVGGTLTGYHGHIQIVDDPINPKQAASPIEIENANNWVEQTLSTRKTDKEVTAMILVMQRLHQNDPAGHLLNKKKDNVKHICLPGEIRNYRELVNPPEAADNYIDDLLDPVRMSWKALTELETDLGQYGYAGQIGQKPTPPGGGMFKVDNISIIDSLPPLPHFVSWIRYWDKAGSVGKGAYTVGVKMGRTQTGKYIIVDVKRGQWGSEAREQIIRSTAEADGRNMPIGIEQEPGSGGLESVQSSIRNLAGFSVKVDRPTGEKALRADPFSVQVNYGNVQLLRGDWNSTFIEELRFFPFSTYKDQVDAASAAFAQLAGKKFVKSY